MCLKGLAVGQGGLFTQEQALSCGLSKQLLQYHLRRGRIERLARSVYRLPEVPPRKQELYLPWLWTGCQGIFSHRTALELLGVLPRSGRDLHLSLPTAALRRLRRLPDGLVLHDEDIPVDERTVVDGLPVVCAERALVQCLRIGCADGALGAEVAFRNLLAAARGSSAR